MTLQEAVEKLLEIIRNDKEPLVPPPSPLDAFQEEEIIGESCCLEELTESGKDSKILVKVIAPGQGSSGFYPPDILERDGPKVFTKGVKMFWDHQTESEARERPEGSLHSLAGELLEDAKYQKNGPKGEGLYAWAKVFAPYKEVLKDIAPHIGVSIRASGVVKVNNESGKPERVVTQLTQAKSVDFVTMAGAGGSVVQLFEAAGRRESKGESMTEQELKELKESVAALAAENKTLKEANATAMAAIAAAQSVQMQREAELIVESTVNASACPDRAKGKVSQGLKYLASGDLPLKEGKLDVDAFTAKVKAKIDDVLDVIREAAVPSGVHGLGEPVKPGSDDEKAFREAAKANYIRMGLSEKAAEIAAKGRI